jgi:hypothetical protein
MGGELGTDGTDDKSVQFLVVRPEGKKKLGRPNSRWKVNIEMRSQLIRCEGMDWIYLAQNRGQWRDHVNTVTKRRVL